MAGRSGVGRRTAVTLVAFMHQMQLFSPKVSRNYGDKQFKADLKNVRFDAVFASLKKKKEKGRDKRERERRIFPLAETVLIYRMLLYFYSFFLGGGGGGGGGGVREKKEEGKKPSRTCKSKC